MPKRKINNKSSKAAKKSRKSNSKSTKRKRESDNESNVSSLTNTSNEMPIENVIQFRGFRNQPGQEEHFRYLDNIVNQVEQGRTTPIGFNQEGQSMIMPSRGRTPPPPPRRIRANRRERNAGIYPLPQPLSLRSPEIDSGNIIPELANLSLSNSTRNNRNNINNNRNNSIRYSMYRPSRKMGGKNKTKKNRKKFTKNA
jgi:hypothetical protein